MVVVVAFFICWIPFHSQRLMFVVVTLYGEWSPRTQYTQHVLFMVVLCSAPSVPRPVFTITEKAPTRSFSWLKVPTIVKLRRGSGKDRQGMAPKVKGLKA